MTIEAQINHAIKYGHPVQITALSLDKPVTGTIKLCITQDNCIVLWTGYIDRHIDYDSIQSVHIPQQKLTLFYVNGKYLDKHASEYAPCTNNARRCALCDNDDSVQYRMIADYAKFYCEKCVAVVEWKDLTEDY